jgi:hypothetical protein
MKLPKIDLTSLPDLDTMIGVFGSTTMSSFPGHDDRIVVLATYVYDANPGGLI